MAPVFRIVESSYLCQSAGRFARRNKNGNPKGHLCTRDYVPEKPTLTDGHGDWVVGVGVSAIAFAHVKRAGSEANVAPQHTENAT
ncbi:hypothetical protein TH4_05340 [Thalassospira tepidiphila MCCC 1A03514]|uniref:Uncharacterized protein n=1 Tax=Thalassospira tepidiphila MCCC 1A03514 TaxID=1177930 RepID=A0A853L297_9PROT|nr:hypothetical protein TH4_05340 [Thalassospira tepidiphila MCCC 1A03514]